MAEKEKHRRRRWVLQVGTLLAMAALTGCGGDDPPTNRAGMSGEDHERGSTPPRIGMTKEQVTRLYGEPMNVQTSRRGEIWSYAFNNFDAQNLIPIYGGWHEAFKKRHSGSITFDRSGRVVDYQWSQSSLRPATIYH